MSPDIAQRIAANRGPVFPPLGSISVLVVAPLTEIVGDDGTTHIVDDHHAVRRGSELFVTEDQWQFILTMVDVRR